MVHYLDKNITNQQNLMDELFKQVSTNNLKKLLQRLDIALTKTQSFVESKSSDILVKIQEYVILIFYFIFSFLFLGEDITKEVALLTNFV